jgi:hypothetical protein
VARTRYTPAFANFAVQVADPFDSLARHRKVPFQPNLTRPVGVLPDDVTVADRLTLDLTNAVLGLMKTLTLEAAFAACAAAVSVAAPAGAANSAQAAAARPVADASRTTPAPRR